MAKLVARITLSDRAAPSGRPLPEKISATVTRSTATYFIRPECNSARPGIEKQGLGAAARQVARENPKRGHTYYRIETLLGENGTASSPFTKSPMKIAFQALHMNRRTVSQSPEITGLRRDLRRRFAEKRSDPVHRGGTNNSPYLSWS